jgi:hypothetical protein
MPSLDTLQLPPWCPGFLQTPLSSHPPAWPYTLVPCPTNQQQTNKAAPFSSDPKSFFSPIGALNGRVRAKRFHSVQRANQRELRSTIPFPFYIIPISGYPFALLSTFTLLSLSVNFLILKEVYGPSKRWLTSNGMHSDISQNILQSLWKSKILHMIRAYI